MKILRLCLMNGNELALLFLTVIVTVPLGILVLVGLDRVADWFKEILSGGDIKKQNTKKRPFRGL